jgi:hypothetical protein
MRKRMSDTPFSGTVRQITGYAGTSGPGAAFSASTGSGAASSRRTEPADRGRSEAAQIADNLLRQRLRVGNLDDPSEVARGLRQLFPREARQLDAEAAGFPMPTVMSFSPAVRAVEAMATSVEIEQAEQAVDLDFLALSRDHRLGAISEELLGWGRAVRATLYDGRAAAALALDPRARDRLMGARRQIQEYARLVRMVGSLNPDTRSSFRKLAADLDGASSLLVVLAGETLAGQRMGDLKFLPSVAASDLQARRDSVISCLREILNFAGGSGRDTFPWSMEGLRSFYKRIEDSGHLDLRALLDEATLGRHLDMLVDLAARNDSPGFRELGATAELSTQKLYRLLAMGDRIEAAPALSHFLKALQIFLDTFKSSQSGYRMASVGRPIIAQRRQAGFGGLDNATSRLNVLIGQRSRLADMADCFLGCSCETEDVLRQIMLDKILHDMDRAIDLYISGSDSEGRGEPEWRAAGYGVLAYGVTNPLLLVGDHRPPHAPFQNFRDGQLVRLLDAIGRELGTDKIDPLNHVPLPGSPVNLVREMVDELCLQLLTDARLMSVLRTMGFGCVSPDRVQSVLRDMVSAALSRVRAGGGDSVCPEPGVNMPDILEVSAQREADAATRGADAVEDIRVNFGRGVDAIRYGADAAAGIKMSAEREADAATREADAVEGIGVNVERMVEAARRRADAASSIKDNGTPDGPRKPGGRGGT